MHPPLRQPGSVFLEVVVVLVVLAVIAAIVFPRLPHAGKRDNPRYQMQCASNVRQLTLAVEMYRQDHAGTFPKATVWMDVSYPMKALSCPTDSENGNGYGYNSWLSNKTLKDPGMLPPQLLPVFADSMKPDNLLSSIADIDGRHDGKATVGFADGHVALSDPSTIHIGRISAP